jgi:nicotinamide mononucleotide (NMN) deamidase PncC
VTVANEGAAAEAVAELVAAGIPRRAAADLVSRITGVARNQLYRSSL